MEYPELYADDLADILENYDCHAVSVSIARGSSSQDSNVRI